MPIIALNNFRTHLLVSTDDFAILFGIELGGEAGGINKVTEHHGELPSFRVGRRSSSNARCDLRGLLSLHNRLLYRLSRWSSDFVGTFGVASPDEPPPFVISHWVHVEEFFLEHIEVLVVQIEAHLQGAIRHSSLTLEER